jgi:hypothetical protein
MPDGHFKVQFFQYKTGLVCRVGRTNFRGRLCLLFFFGLAVLVTTVVEKYLSGRSQIS